MHVFISMFPFPPSWPFLHRDVTGAKDSRAVLHLWSVLSQFCVDEGDVGVYTLRLLMRGSTVACTVLQGEEQVSDVC